MVVGACTLLHRLRTYRYALYVSTPSLLCRVHTLFANCCLRDFDPSEAVWVILYLPISFPSVYVAVPRISQDGINDATLEFKSIVITEPTSKSIHVAQDAVVHSSSSYHPTLDAFNVSLSMVGGQTYGMLELPASQSGDSVATHVEQTVQLTDLDAFTQYNLALLTNKTFMPRVNGSTWLHEGSLPATYVIFDKSASINGESQYILQN